MTGRKIEPDSLNPYRRGRPRPRAPVSEAESKIAWDVLGQFFTGGK